MVAKCCVGLPLTTLTADRLPGSDSHQQSDHWARTDLPVHSDVRLISVFTRSEVDDLYRPGKHYRQAGVYTAKISRWMITRSVTRDAPLRHGWAPIAVLHIGSTLLFAAQ